MNHRAFARLLVVPSVFIAVSCGSTPAASPSSSIPKDARLHVPVDPASTGIPLPIWQAKIDGHDLTIATWSKAAGNSACVAPLVAALEQAQSAWLTLGGSYLRLRASSLTGEIVLEEDEIFERRVSSALIDQASKEKWDQFLARHQAHIKRIKQDLSVKNRLSPDEIRALLSMQVYSITVLSDATSTMPDWTKCIDAATSHHPTLSPISLSDSAMELVKERYKHQLSAKEIARIVILALRTSDLDELGIPHATRPFSAAEWEKRHPKFAAPITTFQRREALSDELAGFMIEQTKLGSSVFAVDIEDLLGSSGLLHRLLERGVKLTQLRLNSPVARSLAAEPAESL